MKSKVKRIDLLASDQDEKNLQLAARKLGSTKISDTIFKSLESFANQMPELFFVNRAGIHQTQSNVNSGLILLQKFADEYKRITAQNCTMEDLQLMLEGLFAFDSEKILHRAITEHITQISIETLRKKYPDQLINEAPAKDLTILFELSHELNFIPEIQQHPALYWNVYSLNGNIISVRQDQLELLLQNYRYYASTPEQLQKLAKVKKLCQVMNELLQDKELIPDRIFSLVYYDREGAIFSPTGSYVIFNAQPQQIRFTR
jgi:hypothetical protein